MLPIAEGGWEHRGARPDADYDVRGEGGFGGSRHRGAPQGHGGRGEGGVDGVGHRAGGALGGEVGGLRRYQSLHTGRLLAGLDERVSFLPLVRGVMAAVVLGTALGAHHKLGAGIGQLGWPTAAYVVLAAWAEWWRRTDRPWAPRVGQAMLVVDSLYLVAVIVSTGSLSSPLRFLFAIHIVSVTILAGNRTGLTMAVWDAAVFALVAPLSLEGDVARLLGVHRVEHTSVASMFLALAWFWGLALAVAAFSAVSERDLRRSRAELAALAELTTQLEEGHDVDAILTTLLRGSMEAFGSPRAALYWGSDVRRRAYRGTARYGSSIDLTPAEVPVGADQFDAVVMAVWAAGAPALVPRLDPAADPVLARLLPAGRNVVVVPLSADGGEAGALALVWGGHLRERVSRHSLTVIGQFAAHASLALRNARLLAELARMAALDPLTGLANRREFEEALAREVGRARRAHDVLSLIILDVDHFKRINDRRGHLAGDGVLVALGHHLREQVRDMDLVARFGGEEFAIILPACDLTNAERVAERIRTTVGQVGELGGITISAGIASLPVHGTTGVALTAAADEALYVAKARGRDRVVVAATPSSGGASLEAL